MATPASPTKKFKVDTSTAANEIKEDKKIFGKLSIEQGLKLNTGYRMPCLGLGTWKSAKNDVGTAVVNAIKAGYRHIDCAAIYGNEKEIGEALQKVWSEGIAKREEVFITSKVFNNHHLDRVPLSCEQTLKDLQLDYIDLLLMHWPIMFEEVEIPQPMRQENGYPNPKLKIKFEYKDTWKQLEKLLAGGKVRSVGVSNFTIEQLTELSKISSVVPAANQIELHPLHTQQPLLEYCQKSGTVITAYSPLGSGDSYSGSRTDTPKLLKEKVIMALADQYKKSPAQILLRWSIQKGVSVIPKSTNPTRIAENADVFDFELTADDMAQVDGLNANYRFGLGWLPGHFIPITQASTAVSTSQS